MTRVVAYRSAALYDRRDHVDEQDNIANCYISWAVHPMVLPPERRAFRGFPVFSCRGMRGQTLSSSKAIISTKLHSKLPPLLLLINHSQTILMNDHGEDKLYCDFHPRESVVGVCAHCLKERLRALAAEQGHHPIPLPKKSSSFFRVPRRKHIIKLPQVFALYRLDSRYHRSKDECDDEGSVVSDEDSFISVKFDDDGHASWDSNEAMTMPTGSVDVAKNIHKANGKKNAVEKTKKSNNLRWKKRIGQILQLARSKRSADKSSIRAGFGGKIALAKGRKGWIIKSILVRTTTTKRQ